MIATTSVFRFKLLLNCKKVDLAHYPDPRTIAFPTIKLVVQYSRCELCIGSLHCSS